MLFAEYKISAFEGVLPYVIQFIDVPNTLVADELVAISAQRMYGWSLREIAFPVVFIKQFLPPPYRFGLCQWQPACSGAVAGRFKTRGSQHCRHQIDVCDNLVYGNAAGKQLRTSRQQ